MPLSPGPQPSSYLGLPSRRVRLWLGFLRRSGLRQVLFFLDCSVPFTRGRLRGVHSPHLPPRP